LGEEIGGGEKLGRELGGGGVIRKKSTGRLILLKILQNRARGRGNQSFAMVDPHG